MPGTLLRDDWQDAIGAQLRQTARSALQVIQDAPRPQAPQVPDPSLIMSSLQQTAQQALGGLQVLGGDAGQGLDPNAIMSSLQNTATQTLGGLQPFNPPRPQGNMMVTPPPEAPQPFAQQPFLTPELGTPAGNAATTQPVRLGQGQQEFIASLQPLAQRVGARTGIDPNVMIAIAANETGWGRSQTAREQNNLFSIQGPSGRASRWATYTSPEQSFEAFVDLISTGKRYVQAWAARADPERFVDELRKAGYVADEPGFPAQGWVDQVKGINRNLPAIAGQVTGAIAQAAAPVVERVQQAGRDISQFGDPQLTNSEAYAACGPAAAVRFAQRFGRNPTLREALDLAKEVGWTQGAGMAGIQSQQNLMTKLGVPTKLVGADVQAMAREAQSGNPVTISTPGHYFYADGYDPNSGAFHVGRSGTDLRGGSEWMTAAQMQARMGQIQGALFADSPLVPSQSGAVELGGQPTPRQRPPIVADQPKPTIFMGAMQVPGGFPGGPGGPPGGDQGRNGLQVIGDVVGPVANDLKNAAGGVLGGAGEAVGGFFSDVGRGAQQVNQDIRTAIGGTDREDYLPLGPSPGGGAVLGVKPPAFETGSVAEQIELGQRDVRDLNPIEGLQYTGQVMGAGLQALPPTYQALAGAKREAIEQNNPIREAFFVGGASSMLADAISDPITWVLPWGKVARVAADIGISAGLKPVAGRIGGEALMNGLQNAAMEMAQPNKTPADVGLAFLIGAGFGGVIRGVQETPQAARIGQYLIDQKGQGWPDLENLLRARQRGELDLGLLTTGEPTPREPVIPPRPPDKAVEPKFPAVPRVGNEPPAGLDVPAGVQRLPTYPAGQIEQRFEDLARQSRETSPDGLAHIALNDLSDDVMPFNVNAPSGQGKVVKLNPGGMPSLDDLRALWRANAHKSSFYVDQGDAAAPLVGTANAEEFFTLNSIMSQRTGVTRQVAEAIQTAGLVRKVARDGRAAGRSPTEIRQDILTAIMDEKQNNYAGKTRRNKYGAVLKGYTTGEAPVSGGAKTSVFAGNYGSAEGRFFDPRITNDIHNWRILNVDSSSIPELRLNKNTGEMEWFYDTPHEKIAANNDQAYRAAEAAFRELANEAGVDGYSMQSSMWDGIRAMQNLDPPSWRLWQQGFFKRAIERAQERGVFGNDPTGQVNLKEGDIQRVMASAPVKRELATWGEYLHDPLPPELGITTVSRTFPGKGRTEALRRPSNLQFRSRERVYAESDAPIVHGMSQDVVDRLGYDPDRGIFPWLEPSHRVVQAAPDEWVVHLPGGNEDTARYVAAQVGRAADADAVRIHVPDYQAPDDIGMYARGEPEQIQALAAALDNMGLPAVMGTGRRSLQVPFTTANDVATIKNVEDAALSVGLDPATNLARYTGRTADVTRPDYTVPERLEAAFAPTTPERSALLQRGLGAVPEGLAEAGGPPGAEPPGGFVAPGGAEPPRGGRVRRARGEAELPFSLNVGGAALGAYAGYAATPEDAEWDERLRNIGVGATTGLLGTAAITRGGGRLAPALARRAEGAEFRAPGVRPGDELLQARTGPREPGPPQEPRNLGEVHSNPHLLREAGPDDVPMTDDELVSHYDALEQRMEDVKSRSEAIDEMLRNPTEKVWRPPWAASWTNEALVKLARRHGANAYTEAWDQHLGFDPGSGEVKWDVGESGLRGTGKTQKNPTELRQELRDLRQEEADLMAAAEQLGSAAPDAKFVPRPLGGEGVQGDLPFDTGAGRERVNGAVEETVEPATVAEAQGGRDEGARLAQEVVLSKGRGRLRSSLGEVTGEGGGVTGRAILSPERVAEVEATPPSARTVGNMPNLDSMLEGDMPEIHAQIRKSAEDNPELFEMYRQGTISWDSLKNDLAARVGMSKEDWLKTPVGRGFNQDEMVALQAAAVEAEGRLQDLGRAIEARDGVDKLSPEELAYSLAELTDAQRILAIARGGRATAGRTLNALKIRFDRTLASAITAGAEAIAAKRTAAEARKAAVRATRLLTKGRELEVEGKVAVAEAKRNGADRSIWGEIEEAYAQLDRYQAMTLHEKGDEFARLAKERADRAVARKARVKSPPEELLSALRAELKAEQNIFAGRKDTWETMAFWDTKANEIAAEKRNAFRGQLYLEQMRKSAQIAAKEADKESKRAFDAELHRRTNQSAKAEKLIASLGGKEVSREILQNFLTALNDPDPLAAAKFLKGMATPSNWHRANIIRVAGLLSAPITHMVNLGGNTGNAMLEVPTRALVVPIDALRVAMKIGPQDVKRQAYKAELLPMMQAYGPGFLGGIGDAVKALQTGVTPIEMTDLSRVRPGFGSGSEAVDAAIEMPLRLLTAEDILFRRGAVSAHGMRVGMRQAIREGFGGEAAKGRAAQILKNLEEYPDLAQEVNDAAARMVFQEKRTLPFISGHETPGVAIARSQVLPFVRTPANITAQGAALSPLGLIGVKKGMGDVGKLGQTFSEKERAVLQVEERLARTLIGSAILGSGLALGAAGMLTANYPEDDQARSALPPGWRPWSMRLEDPITKNTYYVPLQNMAAVGFPLAMAAIITDPTHKGKTILDPDEQLNAATAIGRYVLDNTFLQGLSDMNELLKDPRSGSSKFLEPWVASFGPYSSLNREMLRTFGIAQRNPREGVMGLVDAFEANYPGLAGNVPEALTPLGDPRVQGATGLGRQVPLRYDIEKDEPTLKILRETGIGIPRPPKEISVGRGQSIELTEAEQNAMQRDRGTEIRKAVAEVQTTRAWQTSTPVEKSALMRQAVNYGTRSAIINFYQSLPRVEQDARSKAREVPEPYYIGGAP